MERPDLEAAPLGELVAYIGSPDLVLRYERVRGDVPDTEGFFTLPMFFLGSISRARGLHEGLAEAMASTNPHAAAPLLRQFVETLAAVVYVTRHARYAGAFIHDARVQQQRGGPSRKSPKKLVDWMDASGNAVGFVGMYEELSEATHYGSTAWAFPFQSDEGDDGIVHWQAEPRWKDEDSATAGLPVDNWRLRCDGGMAPTARRSVAAGCGVSRGNEWLLPSARPNPRRRRGNVPAARHAHRRRPDRRLHVRPEAL